MTLCNLYPPVLIPPFPEATKHPLSAFLALDTSEPIEMNRIECSVWQRREKKGGMEEEVQKIKQPSVLPECSENVKEK